MEIDSKEFNLKEFNESLKELAEEAKKLKEGIDKGDIGVG